LSYDEWGDLRVKRTGALTGETKCSHLWHGAL